MATNHPVSGSARQRAREHQRATTKAIAAVEAAAARKETAEVRRAEAIAAQDSLVAATKVELAAAIADLAGVVGVDVASGLLDVSKADVRRAVSDRDEVAA